MPAFISIRVEKFLKGQPTVIGFWALLGFQICYLNEQFGSLSVDLAHRLSFVYIHQYFWLFTDSQIYYVLVFRSCKHKDIFIYYWSDKLKLN